MFHRSADGQKTHIYLFIFKKACFYSSIGFYFFLQAYLDGHTLRKFKNQAHGLELESRKSQ